MRFMAINPAYRLGGPIHSVSSAAESLVRKGHDVIVFATNSNLDEDLDVATDQTHQGERCRGLVFQTRGTHSEMVAFYPLFV